MGRALSPSFVCELALVVTGEDAHRLAKRLEAGRQCYNACLGGAERRRRLMVESDPYQAARKMSRSAAKQVKARTQAFKAVRRDRGYGEYDLHAWATRIKHGWVGEHLDIGIRWRGSGETGDPWRVEWSSLYGRRSAKGRAEAALLAMEGAG